MNYLASTCICALLAMGCGSSSSKPPDDAHPPSDAEPVRDGPVADCTPVSGTDVGLELVASGLSRPVFVSSPPDDARLFILEQPGRIRIFKDGTLLEQPFLDIEDQVLSTGNEQGLLGLAFHPEYAQNGRFFINYTAREPRHDTVIAEYRVSADPDVAETAEKQLFPTPINQPNSNHNGGMLAFGPDGYLYIGLGDGGGANDPDETGQDPTSLLGSMLRIDVDGGDPYGIPSDNPYAGGGDERPEIWAIGLRNPWRFSFDRDTGDLYIADVGQGDWEEVSVQPASSTGGENYGWNTMEGSSCFDPEEGCDTTGLTLPAAEYDHGGDRCSITGGYVYRGTCMPDLQGRYFYADYCSDQVWTFEYAGGQAAELQELPGGLGISKIVSFGEDATGELYVINLDGDVYRIVPAE